MGWLYNSTLNPTVTFHFAGSPAITDIRIYLENTGTGGAVAPAQILIENVSTAFTAPAGVGAVNFSGLNLSGGLHTLQFQQQQNTWTFVSEVQFFGDTGGAIPEPATWAMLISGFGLAGTALRKRNRQVVA